MNRALLWMPLLLLSGCSFVCARAPMKSVRDLEPPPAKARCLVVLLPGAGDHAEDFEQHGFPMALRARGLSVDVVAADATMGYYFKGVLEKRVHEDIVSPLLGGGYRRVFLLGISMGGMGALWYAHEHPSLVTNLVLLSPFLGKDALVEQIQGAGGLAKWPAPAKVTSLDDSNYQPEIWRWLQALLAGREKGPEIVLGFGDRDRGVKELETLAQALPAERVHRTAGPHDWPTWQVLWAQLLSSGELMHECER